MRLMQRVGLVCAVLAGFALSPGVASAAAAPGELCGTYDLATVADGYEVSTDTWNSHGELCITTKGGTDFKVSKSTLSPANANNPNLGPGGYPNIGTSNNDKRLPVAISELGDTTTSWSTTAPDSGTYNVAYDLWYMPNREGCPSVIGAGASTEIMIWLKSPNLPASGQLFQKGKVIDGVTYDVFGFTGPFGQTAVIYAMTTPTSSVKDLKLQPITQDAVERGKVSAAGSLCKVQAGFEIHDQAPAGLGTDSFSLQVKKGESTPPAKTDTKPETKPEGKPETKPEAKPDPEPQPSGDPTGSITSAIPDQCLDDRYNDRADGNPIISFSCNHSDAQRWVLKADGTVVHAAQQDKCLTAAQDKIVLSGCTGAAEQKWKTGAGNSIIGHDGRCVDVPGSQTIDGIQLQLYPCNNTDAQQWTVPVATAAVADPTALFSDAFAGNDRLITNAWANWNRDDPKAVVSPIWEVTSGSLFTRGKVGWSGVPDGVEPDPQSKNGTGSSVFRMNSKRRDFGDVRVDLRLRNLGLRGGDDPTDGLHVWLRQQDQTKLYAASVNRRDNRIVIKKKLTGGDENGGTYYELGSAPYTVPIGVWQSFTITIKTDDGKVTITVAQDGRELVRAVDAGTGGDPILAPGAVGLRADNTEFEVTGFQVHKL
jgi:hypothetical protein